MRNISDYQAEKYKSGSYCKVEAGVFKIGDKYVTSLSFEQEPEYGEGCNSAMISQYPLEDILDEFMVYISDFYDVENAVGGQICCLEFASDDIADIRMIRSLIGKTVRSDNGRLIVLKT